VLFKYFSKNKFYICLGIESFHKLKKLKKKFAGIIC
jgi:hypothetical protein